MKNLIILIIIFFSLNSFGQKNNANEYQKKWFSKGNVDLKNSELDSSLINFYQAYQYNPNSKLGTNYLKKIDSIKPIVRIDLIEKWKGTWELINDESNDKHYLVVSESEIKFYEKRKGDKKKILTQTEKIVFNEINYGLYPAYWELVFSDNQVWNFNILENIDENILHTSKTNKVGVYTIKHRNIYRDGREQKDERITYKRIKKLCTTTPIK